MPKAHDPIANLRMAAPCQTSWEGMAGNERVRHCTLCNLNVYNFAEMTRDEVRELLVRTEGRICARLYRRADGTVLTRDCPTGLRALRRRASRVAAAAITMMLSLPSLAFGGTIWKKPRFQRNESKVKLQVERVVTAQPAVLDFVVRDVDDTPIPGVTITVRDEISKREITEFTDVNGAFHIASLNDGLYRVEVSLEGFRPARIERLQLKASEVTRVSVALRTDATYIIMGAIAPETPMMNIGVSTTFSQDFINKMPL
jgi:hypothetical protein